MSILFSFNFELATSDAINNLNGCRWFVWSSFAYKARAISSQLLVKQLNISIKRRHSSLTVFETPLLLQFDSQPTIATSQINRQTCYFTIHLTLTFQHFRFFLNDPTDKKKRLIKCHVPMAYN